MGYWLLRGFVAGVAVAGIARTAYLRRWYGNYDPGAPLIGGWGGMRLGVIALLLLLFLFVLPYLHLGVSEPY